MLLTALLVTVLLEMSEVKALSPDELDAFTDAVTVDVGETTITLSSNNIPEHDYGSFNNDDNPNTVQTQDFQITIPMTPVAAGEPSCLPMGPIGMMYNGVGFFNPYTIEKTDAVENEVFDDCNGHPDQTGFYHYHQNPNCLGTNDTHGEMLGVALDGYPVYEAKDEDGNMLTSDDLDECHGREVEGVYRYHITTDFPYILGCFHGVLIEPIDNKDCEFARADADADADADAGSKNFSSVLVLMGAVLYGLL